jgi:hypothetical protein
LAPVQYSLVYEHSYWKDADFIEPDRDAWHDLAFAFEDILERTPEIHPVVRPDGGRILPTLEHFGAYEMPPMFVLYRILKPAPDGQVLMMRVAREDDVRAGRFRELNASENAAPAPFQEPHE